MSSITPSINDKFCSDCLFYFENPKNSEFSKCKHSAKIEYLIDKKTSQTNENNFYYCTTERNYGNCGPLGKNFQWKTLTIEHDDNKPNIFFKLKTLLLKG
jgi:hypothetical protein